MARIDGRFEHDHWLAGPKACFRIGAKVRALAAASAGHPRAFSAHRKVAGVGPDSVPGPQKHPPMPPALTNPDTETGSPVASRGLLEHDIAGVAPACR